MTNDITAKSKIARIDANTIDGRVSDFIAERDHLTFISLSDAPRLKDRKLKVMCKHHGVKEGRALRAIRTTYGCSDCAHANKWGHRCASITLKDIQARVQRVLDRSPKVTLVNISEGQTFADRNVTVRCTEHGEREHRAEKFVKLGMACKECSLANMVENIKPRQDAKTIEARCQSRLRDGITLRDTTDFSNGIESSIHLNCPTHGDFNRKANLLFVKDHPCPKCSRADMGARAFIKESDLQNDIDKAVILAGGMIEVVRSDLTKGLHSPVDIVCSKHGIKSTTVTAMAQSAVGGCSKCAMEVSGLNSMVPVDKLRDEVCALLDDTIDTSKADFSKGVMHPMDLSCTVCDLEFKRPPYIIRKKDQEYPAHGCPACSMAALRLTKEEMLERLATPLAHPKLTQTDPNNFTGGYNGIASFNCSDHGDFDRVIRHIDPRAASTCTNCTNRMRTSIGEREVLDFVLSLDVDARQTLHRHNGTGYELDVHVEASNFAIEYDGVFFHGDKNLDAKDAVEKQLKKQVAATSHGIDLISVFSDEWENKRLIVEDIIRGRLGKLDRIGARKLTVEYDPIGAAQFLNDNHLLGSDNSTSRIALMDGSEIIMMLTFSTPSYRAFDGMTLNRMAIKNGVTVQGGMTRLLTRWRKDNPGVDIQTLVDVRLFKGASYIAAGFEDVTTHGKPDYFWVFRGVRYHKNRFTKAKIKDAFDKGEINFWEEGLTEDVLMRENKAYKIWDSGKRKLVLKA